MNVVSDIIFSQDYDVIIVGGGPAGTTAAHYAALNGAHVIVFERDPVIGIPVRCGEGISRRGLLGYVPLHGPWIANKLNHIELIAPDNTAVEIKSSIIGYILDRMKFDKLLEDKAEQSGAKIVTNADVIGLIKNNNTVAGVKVDYNGRKYEVNGKIIIGADGVESRIGRWAGIDTVTKLNNMESSFQVYAKNISVDPSVCLFYFGREIAPGGYLWVFPKDACRANIGVGISGNYSREKPAEQYLTAFMNRHFPSAEWIRVVAGGVPCNPPLKELVKNNIMLAGDAGHQVNPLTGAGIANALQAGRLAGVTAAEALKTSRNFESSLSKYTKRWYKARGRLHSSSWKLKNIVMNFDDETLNKLAYSLKKMPVNELTVLKLFMLAVKNHPEVLVDCLKLFRRF